MTQAMKVKEEQLRKRISQLERQVGDLSATAGRLHHERAYFREQAKKWYERNRLIENRLRGVVETDDLLEMRRVLLALHKRIPVKPRKVWGWRQSGSL